MSFNENVQRKNFNKRSGLRERMAQQSSDLGVVTEDSRSIPRSHVVANLFSG